MFKYFGIAFDLHCIHMRLMCLRVKIFFKKKKVILLITPTLVFQYWTPRLERVDSIFHFKTS